MNSGIMLVEENISSPLSSFSSQPLSCSTFFASIFFLIFSCTFFCLLGRNLLPDLLLHLDAITSMSFPVGSLASFVAVASLKQENMMLKLIKIYTKRTEVFLPSCTLRTCCLPGWTHQHGRTSRCCPRCH